jgi:ATP synthase subunit 6
MLINLIYSPLDQFEVIKYNSFGLFNSVIFIFITLFFIVLSQLLTYQQRPFLWTLNHRWGLFFDFINKQLMIIVIQNLNIIIGQRYFVWLYVFFILITSWNIIGMIPYSFTITSHIVVTFGLSFFFFFGINIRHFVNSPLGFWGLFLPSGVPFVIIPFLCIIEIISYIARVFSLAIRLFANIIAGHTLIKILIAFVYSLLLAIGDVNWLFLPLAILPFIVVCLITFLEVAIAILQAYVFLVLLCIYIKDVYKAH